MDTVTKQLWLVTRIWLVAVGVNALLGAAFMGFHSGQMDQVAGNFILIIIFGGIFSIPVPLVLWATIALAANRRMRGLWLLSLLYALGIALTFVVFYMFHETFSDSHATTFLWLAVISGVAGITTFYKSIVRWGSGFSNPQ